MKIPDASGLELVMVDPSCDDVLPSVVTIGTFDGMHQGHRAVLAKAREIAAANGSRVVAVTFHPRPETVLSRSQALPDIVALSERVDALREAGADRVVVIRFTNELASRSADEFLSDVRRMTGMEVLCVGEDFKLGKGGQWDVEAIGRLGVPVVAVSLVPGSKSNVKASSTHIRWALAKGINETAARALA